ncbi:hypothetical protein ACFL9U_15490, partial [Thermodesulfobacteriota bacterium]
MNSKIRILAGITIIVLGLAFFASQVDAAISIGKISGFEGEAYILSGTDIGKVEFVGQLVNTNDKIQTKDGTVDVTLNDGAFIKISPYSTTAVAEREEETGWLFKRKSLVRRITCFVGKLRFKSGDKVKDNFFQTPTAVCGLRGSEGELGYNPAKLESYLQIFTGDAGAFKGNFLRGFFENPGIDAATKSKVWNQLSVAARYDGDAKKTDGEKKLSASLVLATAAQELKDNPDADVQGYAQESLDAANLSITAAKQDIENEIALEKYGTTADQLDETDLAEMAGEMEDALSEVVKETYDLTDDETVTEMTTINQTIADTEAALAKEVTVAEEEA